MNKKCVDCGIILSNRRKTSLRCRKCRVLFLHNNKHGRILPPCIICGKTLSVKNNKTSMCRECQISRHVPWNKGIKGLIPWNKGLSLFENKKAYRLHVNKIRREKRKFQTAKEYLSDRIRTLIRNQIKRYGKRNKNTKTELLLGCNANFFREYLENLFTDGMSWNNYGNGEGKWNIDHIIPVSSYDLSTIEEQKKCFHFSNCRPMWSIENIKKRNKIVTW